MKNSTTQKHPFRSARKAGVPLMAISTADPQATIKACAAARNGKPEAFLEWDCVRALRGLDAKGSEIAATIGEPADTQNLVQCLDLIATKKPGDCTVFIHNAQAALGDYTAKQAIWNLRDILKTVGSMLVMMGPSLAMPPELSSDVPVFDEPIPTGDDISGCIDSAVNDAKRSVEDFPAPTTEERERIMDTLTGYLSVFAIEQSLALSTTKDGLDLRKLWELKVSSLKNTAGLEISQPVTTFADMAGCYSIKKFLSRVLSGRKRPHAIYFLDELEKSLAGGTGGDLSGTTQKQIEQFLYWTEERKVLAILLVGVPGGGKSWTAQCTAGEGKIPLLRGSISAAQGSLVGQSTENMRNMLKAVDSVSQGQTLMIATCNSVETLSPEVLSRFKLGIFVYDYPNEEESESLWSLYRKRYELTGEELPQGIARWTGREIESCCHRAWLFQCSLTEAAESVVPVCRANKAKMEALRSSLSGRFLSAANPGVYDSTTMPTRTTTGRQLGL